MKALRAAISVVLAFAFLLALVVGLAPNADTRAVQLGDALWDNYASELRSDPVAPTCDLQKTQRDAETCTEPDTGAQGSGSTFDPFAAAPRDTSAVSCQAKRNLAVECEARTEAYELASERLTASVRAFRTVETAIGAVAKWSGLRHLLAFITLLGCAAASLGDHHLAIRPIRSRTEHIAAHVAQSIAFALWSASCFADWGVLRGEQAPAADTALSALWSFGFLGLTLLHVTKLANCRRVPADRPTSAVRVVLAIPLFATMAVFAGTYFTAIEGHTSGLAIYLHKFAQHPTIYLGIGLYIWAGMMFARTKVADLVVDAVASLGLSTAMMAWLMIMLAAVPTAYSGASGILVIAAGAVIFRRLVDAGASRRMALAATAMSGSLGVVLRPCLVVVLIATLNKQVTTDELFSAGLRVFALTAVLSFVAFGLWSRRTPRAQAVPEPTRTATQAIRALLPYLVVAAGTLLAYKLLLATSLDEHSAALVVPGVMLATLLWERSRLPIDRLQHIRTDVQSATSDTSRHVGALLLLMCGSIALGGVVERAELLRVLPSDLGTPFVAMTILVVLLVVIGMTMDALGAVVLVSVSLAELAYANGIAPVHFWMVVLVGFELGYLTPPVALNHLLARAAIGADADLEQHEPVEGFWAKHQHLIVPVAIMGTALLLVAYIPLLAGG